MRCDVVEGEPGIFPEPITRFMRTIGGLFGGGKPRQSAEDQSSTGETGAASEPADTDAPGAETTSPDRPDPGSVPPPASLLARRECVLLRP